MLSQRALKMIETRTECGIVKEFDQDEAEELFGPLRNRIFDTSSGWVTFHESERIFQDDGWWRVLVRGGLFFSDGSARVGKIWKREDELLEWAKDDPRDPLHALFEILVEDGIRELIQMSPYSRPGPFTGAMTTAPTRSAVHYGRQIGVAPFTGIVTRLLFDKTGRWGLFADDDELGILAGEPLFLERYIWRAGGMEFIRQKADDWFRETYDEWKRPTVPRAYELAGWDNPPQPKKRLTRDAE